MMYIKMPDAGCALQVFPGKIVPAPPHPNSWKKMFFEATKLPLGPAAGSS